MDEKAMELKGMLNLCLEKLQDGLGWEAVRDDLWEMLDEMDLE